MRDGSGCDILVEMFQGGRSCWNLFKTFFSGLVVDQSKKSPFDSGTLVDAFQRGDHNGFGLSLLDVQSMKAGPVSGILGEIFHNGRFDPVARDSSSSSFGLEDQSINCGLG